MTRPLCPRCRNPGYLRAAFATGIIGHDIRAVPERARTALRAELRARITERSRRVGMGGMMIVDAA
jgi:hypothetical protein